jgi:Diadenosine tetraphosphate (Ap4A) hydrolase and other HIT family hydrolases
VTADSPHPDALWAPWRLAYIKGESGNAAAPEPASWRPGAETGCFLCRAAAVSEDHDRDLGVIERTPQSIVVLNRYPYANGHLLVAPLDHRATLADLADSQLLDLQQRLAAWCSRLEQTLQCQGLNVGLNLGRVAGAGLPGHLHWHIVPRWPGDVNFMTSVAGVRVIPQALDSLWEQLREGR